MEKEILYISLGENCLTDNILQRFGIKSFSTPYSHGRTNIDYAIHLEKEKYSNLLNPNFLYYDYIGDKKVVRNTYYSKSDNIYNNIHLKGFEFTHHDVISNEKHKKSYERKIERITSLHNNYIIKFFYHYRKCNNQCIENLIDKLKTFLSFYQNRGIDCQVIFFTQEIVLLEEERSLIKIHYEDSIKGYIFRTLQIWDGEDQEIFLAKKDDDLISIMISETKL